MTDSLSVGIITVALHEARAVDASTRHTQNMLIEPEFMTPSFHNALKVGYQPLYQKTFFTPF
jgi:hypothetical protein